MGRDKAQIRFGSRTMLGHVRATAAELGVPVRVQRKDFLGRYGPLGGIYTALLTSAHDAILFLPCDMPLLHVATLRLLLAKFDGTKAVFASTRGTPGFPLVLPRSLLPVVEQQINREQLALHELAETVRARLVRVAAAAALNINTPEDLARAQKLRHSAQEQLVKRQ